MEHDTEQAPRPQAPGLAQVVARAVMAFAVAIAAGAASNSVIFMLVAFAASILVLHLGGALLSMVGNTTWGEKPMYIVYSLASSVKTAAMAVGAFGIFIGGHVSLNLVLVDLKLQPVDLVVGIIPFVGIVAYCFITTLDGTADGKRKHPVRAVIRGVTAAGMAAVILYMSHAVMHVTGFVPG